jgi:hypothetical protein
MNVIFFQLFICLKMSINMGEKTGWPGNKFQFSAPPRSLPSLWAFAVGQD